MSRTEIAALSLIQAARNMEIRESLGGLAWLREMGRRLELLNAAVSFYDAAIEADQQDETRARRSLPVDRPSASFGSKAFRVMPQGDHLWTVEACEDDESWRPLAGGLPRREAEAVVRTIRDAYAHDAGRRRLTAVIQEYLGAKEHDLCHENRRKLAAAIGEDDKIPACVTRAEFERGCVEYQDQIFGPRVTVSPTASELLGAVLYLSGDDAESSNGPGREAAWAVVHAVAEAIGGSKKP